MRKTGVITLRALVLVVLLAGPASAGVNVWTGGGPEGAAVRAVLVDPLSPSTIYVGTAGNGIFKSINNGDTWTQPDISGTLATRTIRALVISGGTLYAGTDDAVDATSGGVFQSTDGGTTWNSIGTQALGLTNRKVQALLLDGSTLYAGTREDKNAAGSVVTGGVFKWNGTLWTQINGVAPNALPNQSARRVQALAVDARPGLAVHVIYAGTQGEGVFKTFDGGANWLRLDNPNLPNQGFKSDCLFPPEILALQVDETVAYPPGTTDATLYAGATGAVPSTGSCAAPVDRGAGFFKFTPVSPPAFGSWDRKMNGDLGDSVPTTTSTQVWAIALKRDDPNPPRLYIGTDLGVFTSADRAQSWDGVPRPPHPDNLVGLPIRALGMDPAGGVTLYAGSAGRGMFRRSPNFPAVGEDPWTPINAGLTAIRAQAAAVGVRGGSKVVLQGLSGGGVLTSTVTSISQGTPVWLETSEPDRTVRSIATDPTNASTIYAATGRGVLKSLDGGNSWAFANGTPPNVLPTTTTQDPNFPTRTVRSIIVDPSDPNTLYAAVGGIFRSVDGGTTWTSANGNLPSGVTTGDGAVAAIVIDQDSAGVDPIWGNLYVATDTPAGTPGQGVFVSTNGGGTWTQFNNGISVADQHILSLALDPLPTPKKLYAGTSTGLVYMSPIGTSSWTPAGTGLVAPAAVNGLAVRLGIPSTIYAGLDSGGVYVLLPNSSSWTTMNSGLTSLNVGGLGFDPVGAGTLYAATLGRGTFHFQFDAGSPPSVIIDSPPPPTFSTATSPVTITGRAAGNGGIFGMFWYTNRGHAAALQTGANPWTATVPLEPGANVITITAVDGSFNQGSAAITVTLVSTAHDFNGDGKADILWRNTSNLVYVWLMNGTSTSSAGSPGSVNPTWTVQGTGDFNGDGKTDILWRDAAGLLTIWFMNGTSVSSTGSPGSVDASYTFLGIGDFNGDGKSDILWRRASGNIEIWLMDGTSIIGTGTPASIDGSWTFQGIGDFDADGRSDVLWRNTSGLIYIWFMNGTTITSAAAPATVGTEWTIKGVGDFTGDGKADVLWRHDSGLIYIWVMNGGVIQSAGSPTGVDSSWTIEDVVDFNGDGKADVLWRHSSGLIFIWLMNGTAIGSTGSPGGVGPEWVIQ